VKRGEKNARPFERGGKQGRHVFTRSPKRASTTHGSGGHSGSRGPGSADARKGGAGQVDGSLYMGRVQLPGAWRSRYAHQRGPESCSFSRRHTYLRRADPAPRRAGNKGAESPGQVLTRSGANGAPSGRVCCRPHSRRAAQVYQRCGGARRVYTLNEQGGLRGRGIGQGRWRTSPDARASGPRRKRRHRPGKGRQLFRTARHAWLKSAGADCMFYGGAIVQNKGVTALLGGRPRSQPRKLKLFAGPRRQGPPGFYTKARRGPVPRR